MGAKTEEKKNELIETLVEVRAMLIDEIALLPLPLRGEVCIGGWSAFELLAHLIGWDYANQEAVQSILAGNLPGFYNYHDHDWKTFNALLVAQHRRDNFDEMIAAVRESHHKLVDQLRAVPDVEFDRDRGIRMRGYRVTIARLLQAEIEDEKTHWMQIKQFAEKPRQGRLP